MPAWDDYTLKEKPGDEDTLMIKDNAATTNANKRTKFRGLWNWIVDKLAAAVIANLNTTNKTVIGALNELNSNTWKTTYGIRIEENENMNNMKATGSYYCRNKTVASSLLNCPVGSGFTLKVEYSTGNDSNYLRQILFCGDNICIRNMSGADNWGSWVFIRGSLT